MYEDYPNSEAFVLPPDIETLLETSLVESGLPGNDTKKFFIEGHSGLLVRYNPGYPADQFEVAKAAWEGMTDFGVRVLPARIINHKDEAYVVTKFIEGTTLEEALRNNPSSELVQETDRTWHAHGRYIATRRRQGGNIPDDIDTAAQYMVTSEPGETTPQVVLVDLPYNITDTTDNQDYDVAIINFTNGVHEIEQLTGTQMAGARMALYEMLQLHEDSAYFGNGVWQAAAKVLEKGLILEVDDEHIDIDDYIANHKT